MDIRRIIPMVAIATALSGTTLATTSAAALASAEAQTRDYNIVMTQTLPLPSAGVIIGKMTLSVARDGLINGWYLPADAGPPVEVIGSKHGSDLWLEIGSMGSLRVYGSVNKTGMIGGTATQYPQVGSSYSGAPPTFSFTARPTG